MTQNEYIAAGSDVGELLQIAEQLPGVTVKKIGSRYVVFEATERDAARMSERLAGRVKIALNQELGIPE